MKISTSWNTSPNTEKTITGAYSQPEQDLGGTPDWLAAHASVAHNSRALLSTLSRIPPNVSIHFLGTFAFGEQGCFIDGQNHHANLMISAILFEK